MVVAGRRRWAVLAVVVASCGGLTEKAPVTYTRAPNIPDDLVNDASTAATPDTPDDAGAADATQLASSADAGSKPTKPGPSSKPADANLCYKKLSGGCCDDAVTKKRGKNGCPKGYVAAGSCIPRASCPP
ncbi:MAG TPA: hypothetical protein VIF62_09330 [Labilithrix sp.]|jgi:hypothetical protein